MLLESNNFADAIIFTNCPTGTLLLDLDEGKSSAMGLDITAVTISGSFVPIFILQPSLDLLRIEFTEEYRTGVTVQLLAEFEPLDLTAECSFELVLRGELLRLLL